jgi:hypothetical protein
MTKTKKAKKPQRPPREFWGNWINRSDTLIYHPFNRNGAKVMKEAYANLILSVQVSEQETVWGTVTHLWVRRHDSQPLTWREMQRIKNELIGPERVAVEVYPAVSELIDQANMYHLWVLPEGFTLPFSLNNIEAATEEIAAAQG